MEIPQGPSSSTTLHTSSAHSGSRAGRHFQHPKNRGSCGSHEQLRGPGGGRDPRWKRRGPLTHLRGGGGGSPRGGRARRRAGNRQRRTATRRSAAGYGGRPCAAAGPEGGERPPHGPAGKRPPSPSAPPPRGTTPPSVPCAVPVATGSQARAPWSDAQGQVTGGPARPRCGEFAPAAVWGRSRCPGRTAWRRQAGRRRRGRVPESERGRGQDGGTPGPWSEEPVAPVRDPTEKGEA